MFLSLFPRLRLIGARRRVVPVVKGDEVFLSDDPGSMVKVSMTIGMTRKHPESDGRRAGYIYHPLVHG